MKRYFIAGIFIMGAIFGKNDYPIVLIHGFLGWGPDEMGGYKYWGGKDDIADLLRHEAIRSMKFLSALFHQTGTVPLRLILN